MHPENMNLLADQVEAHPHAYTQSDWGHCLAGHCVLAGGAAKAAPCGGLPNNGYSATFLDEGKGERVNIPSYAQSWLGLSDYESDLLFGGAWSPPYGHTVPVQLRRYADGVEEIGDEKDPNAVPETVPASKPESIPVPPIFLSRYTPSAEVLAIIRENHQIPVATSLASDLPRVAEPELVGGAV